MENKSHIVVPSNIMLGTFGVCGHHAGGSESYKLKLGDPQLSFRLVGPVHPSKLFGSMVTMQEVRNLARFKIGDSSVLILAGGPLSG